MKVTFPHMGNAYIPIKALLKGLKLDVVVPPLVSKRTLELGMKYSPEYACMPLKINMGNFIEAMENGANAIVMAGGWGPCRFGYYAQVERDILRDLGYDFKMIVLEAPDSKLSELLKQVKALGENVSMRQAYQAVKFAWYKLNAVEALERKLEYYLPRVIDKTTCETIYEQGLRDIDQVSARKEVDICLRESLKKLETLPQHHEPVLRLGLIGEIYTILEPGANYHVARSLGRLGVEVTRSIYLSEWVNIHLTGGWLKKNRHREIIKMSRPYLNYWVGGHGRETVAYAVDFARQGYDGLIQIGPLTCMPEIVAQSVLGRVSDVEGIPCMTLYFDEHDGAAGINTRLEAFVDMLRRKKTVPAYDAGRLSVSV